eukprot:c19767_g1_i1 orf=81-1433(+)
MTSRLWCRTQQLAAQASKLGDGALGPSFSMASPSASPAAARSHSSKHGELPQIADGDNKPMGGASVCLDLKYGAKKGSFGGMNRSPALSSASCQSPSASLVCQGGRGEIKIPFDDEGTFPPLQQAQVSMRNANVCGSPANLEQESPHAEVEVPSISEAAQQACLLAFPSSGNPSKQGSEGMQRLVAREQSENLQDDGLRQGRKHEKEAFRERGSGSGRKTEARWQMRGPKESVRGDLQREVEGGSGGRDNQIDSLGRILTRILRHQAAAMKLNIRSDGYVAVEDLLNLKIKTQARRPLNSHTVDDVLKAVEQDNKQRLGILIENGRLLIRANQGHSMQVVESEKLLEPILCAEEVPVCVHGTFKANMHSITREGLNRMKRNHVHFASGLPNDGVISGMKSHCEVLIYLDVQRALADGMKLYRSENGVILTEGFGGTIPPKYFSKIVNLPR